MTHLSSSSFTRNLNVPQYHSPEFLTISFVISFLSILLFYGYLIFVQFYSNHRSSWISTPLNGILIWISNACNQKATFEILKFSLIVGAQDTNNKHGNYIFFVWIVSSWSRCRAAFKYMESGQYLREIVRFPIWGSELGVRMSVVG